MIAVECMLKDEVNQVGALASLNLATRSATKSDRGREILMNILQLVAHSQPQNLEGRFRSNRLLLMSTDPVSQVKV
jgi:hypothetical protein